jgi:hypothetical protein
VIEFGNVTYTIADVGGVAISDVGTELGTFVIETMTADGSEAIDKTSLDLNDETKLAETITGDTHDEGTAIVNGTLTKTLAGTE